MKRKIFIAVVILTILVSALSVAACTAQKRPGPVPTPDPVQPNATNADRLAENIAGMAEVNAATVVLSGSKAWVGIDLAANAGGTVTNEVKDKVTDMVKQQETGVTTVYVTADADSVTRLKNIAQDIAAGKPISGFLDELNEIGRRITPSVQ